MDSFRRLIRGIRDFRTLLWFAGFVLAGAAALWSKGASAQTTGGSVRVTAVAQKPQAFSSTGELLSHATYEGRFAAASTGAAPMSQSLYYQRQVTFPKATTAALVRKRIAQSLPIIGTALLIKDLMTGAGLTIDASTGAIYGTPSQGTALPPGHTGWWCSFTNSSYGSVGAAAEACRAQRQINIGSGTSIQGINWVVNDGAYKVQFNNGTTNITPVPNNMVGQPDPGNNLYVAPGAATDDQIVNALKTAPQTHSAAFAQQAWAEPFHWPNGAPVIANPMPAQMAQVATQFRADTGVALAAGTTDPTYADESASATPTQTTAPSALAGTSAPPASAAASASVEFPVFCTWAATVCAALDWVTDDTATDPPAAELPVTEVPVVSQPFNSGLGGGTCPGAFSASFEFAGTQSVEFSYQPLCDFAVFLNPLLQVLGALVAAFIISGRLRRA